MKVSGQLYTLIAIPLHKNAQCALQAGLGGPQSWAENFKEKNLLHVPEYEPRIIQAIA
jgi:hypothetical protein